MVFFTYQDLPGVIGTVGTILGEHGVNIATMEVGRKAEGGEALMGLTVDATGPPARARRTSARRSARAGCARSRCRS